MTPIPITAETLPLDALAKAPDAHKYDHGHALVLSGGLGRTGAARLVARGALRVGAGLVTIACPRAAIYEIAAQTTAVMCQPLDGAPGLSELLEDQRLNALCLGPGLGLGPDTQFLVLAALKANRATVLDADALTRFERNPEVLFDALHDRSVLTPHAGEFKRLFPDLANQINTSERADCVVKAAAHAGCTVLLKGADTLIADPGGQVAVHSANGDAQTPWLATAGSGDVLAGIITGLMARGFTPFEAAKTGVWLHAASARTFGPGLIAEDIPESLPEVFRALGL